MSTTNKGDFLLGMLVGASVGAALAILYAPASGQETREQVKNAAGDAVGKAGEFATSLKDKAADVASRVKSQAQDLASRAPGMAQQATEKVTQAAGSLKDSAVNAVSGGNGQEGDNWAAGLPDTGAGDKSEKRDLHELQTSDDPDVVADRVNNAMQGSGEEAHDIAEELAKAPGGSSASS